jgi:hypothetical protein
MYSALVYRVFACVRTKPRNVSCVSQGLGRLDHTRGIVTGRDRIFAEPKLYEPLGTGELIREQSWQRFGRMRRSIEKRR